MDVRIYIDEVWPDCVNKTDEFENIGIISGIIWLKGNVDYSILPHIKTHIKSKETILKNFNNLNNCEYAVPFATEIDLNKNPMKEYLTMTESSIKILLGWVLKRGLKKADDINVSIYLENIGGFQNVDKTEYFKGILKQAFLNNPKRFEFLKIKEVSWKEKDFEYIPYADLIGYPLNRHTKTTTELFNLLKYENMDFYFKFNQNLFTVLNRLDDIENTNFVEDIFVLFEMLENSKMLNLVLKELKPVIANNELLKEKIIEHLDKLYEDENKNVNLLGKIFNYFEHIISNNKSKKNNLNYLLLSIKKNNYEGNALNFYKNIIDYEKLNLNSKENIELFTELNLNIGVLYNDCFKFENSLNLFKEIVESNYFEYLKPLIKSKIYSSLAQSYSLLKKHNFCERYIDKAIEILRCSNFDDSEEINKNLKKYYIYKLTNELDSENELSDDCFKKIFENSDEFINNLTDDINPYSLHLFVKLLYFNKDFKKYILKYLYKIKKININIKQHPYELINFYTALLFYESNDLYNSRIYFEPAIKTGENGGIINKHISAVIKMISNKLIDDKINQKEVKKQLTPAISVLNRNLDKYLISDFHIKEIRTIIKELLPFYYH